MKKFVFAAAIVSIGVIVFAIRAEAQGIKEGKWSMTVVTKMGGMGDQAAEAIQELENMSPEDRAMMEQMMGGMGIGANGDSMGITTTTTTCVTNDNPVPDTNPQENCQETHSIQGNTVNFESVCDDGRSTGQVTYQDDFMKGTIQSQTDQGAATIEITGQYVGPCNEA